MLQRLELSVKILGDIFESYLAALTLDKGLESAESFLEKHLYPKLKVGGINKRENCSHLPKFLYSLQDTVLNSQLVDANTRLNQAAAFTCKQQGVGLQLPVFRSRRVNIVATLLLSLLSCC